VVPPLLVRVLAGNPLAGATILACLTMGDAKRLRRLCPAVAAAVAGVPWDDTSIPVLDAVRWRAALPAAVGAQLSYRVVRGLLTSAPALAALAGVTRLDMNDCDFVTDELLLRLPDSLRVLSIRSCDNLTPAASLVHLNAPEVLDCSLKQVSGLPPSLRELVDSRELADVSLAYLPRLQVVRCTMDHVSLASLPPSLLELHAGWCDFTPATTSFAHLPALHTLDISYSRIDNAVLATLPPSLESLDIHSCMSLTPAAVLPHLPVLRLADMSGTNIGDALVASLPASLIELRLVGCRGVTPSAALDHLCTLRVLHSCDSALAPAVLAGCRARGCAVPAGALRGHRGRVTSLAVLADGRLASGDAAGELRLWETAECSGGDATTVLQSSFPGSEVRALAPLPDGRLASAIDNVWPYFEVWDVRGVLPKATSPATVACGGGVLALAALAGARVAVGLASGTVRVVDVDSGRAGAKPTDLEGHTGGVMALVALPDGRLASGSSDATVRVWNVGARTCEATLAGHRDVVRALAALADGTLASGSSDKSVRLWDVAARTCVRVLTGHDGAVTVLAALPDGRLASGSDDCTVRVWDTRPAARATAAAVPGRFTERVLSLAALPGGRLACCTNRRYGGYYGADWLVHLLDVPVASDV